MQGISSGTVVNPSSVTTANSYSLLTTLSKDTSTDWLQVAASGKTLKMPEGLGEFVFTQLQLYPVPNFTNPIYLRIQVKLKADSLDNDLSVPRISHIWDSLICFVTGSLYSRLGQISKAQAQEQMAMQHIQAAVNVEKNQSEMRQQVVPTVYETGDYLGRGFGRPTSYDPFGVIW